MPRDNVTIHVFYGVAGIGKSTHALRFAHERGIRTLIHTDYVREVQKACTLLPARSVLSKVTHTAWELFGEPSTEHIIQGFTHHVDAVTPALLVLGHKLARDGLDAIVEGVHCYSNVVEQFRRIEGLVVQPHLLLIASEARLLERIQHKEAERSLASESKIWARQRTILLTIQQFLIQDAMLHQIEMTYLE
jgi:2-phosphoglycerate kinase